MQKNHIYDVQFYIHNRRNEICFFNKTVQIRIHTKKCTDTIGNQDTFLPEVPESVPYHQNYQIQTSMSLNLHRDNAAQNLKAVCLMWESAALTIVI